MRHTVFAILLLSASRIASAQSEYVDNEPKSFLHPGAVQLMAGFEMPAVSSVSIAELQNLLPESSILNSDLTGFDGQNQFYGLDPGFSYAALLSWKVKNKQKDTYRTHFEFRTGLAISSSTDLGMNMSKKERHTFDTLTSNQNGEQFFRDSVFHNQINIHRKTNYVRLDLSAIWRTNPAKTWQFYTGGGVLLGAGFGSEYHINRYDQAHTEVHDGTNLNQNQSSEYFWFSNNSATQTETFRSTGSWSVAAYVPFGVQLRLGKNPDRIWSRLHMLYEGRRGVIFTSIPDFGTIGKLYFGANWGLRYVI